MDVNPADERMTKISIVVLRGDMEITVDVLLRRIFVEQVVPFFAF